MGRLRRHAWIELQMKGRKVERNESQLATFVRGSCCCTYTKQVAWHVALIAGSIACPPPFVLRIIALAQHDQRLIDVEAQLVAVLRLVGEDGIDIPIVQYAQLLLYA